MNFSAALAERIQLKFFRARVLRGQRGFGTPPRSRVVTAFTAPSPCLLRAWAVAASAPLAAPLRRAPGGSEQKPPRKWSPELLPEL